VPVAIISVPAGPTPSPRKITWREQQELTQLESRIQKLEDAKTDLLDGLGKAGSDYVRLEKLGRQIELVDAELETALARWVELAELS
jgi:ATP-binding cassette subfamily F protein uup